MPKTSKKQTDIPSPTDVGAFKPIGGGIKKKKGTKKKGTGRASSVPVGRKEKDTGRRKGASSAPPFSGDELSKIDKLVLVGEPTEGIVWFNKMLPSCYKRTVGTSHGSDLSGVRFSNVSAEMPKPGLPGPNMTGGAGFSTLTLVTEALEVIFFKKNPCTVGGQIYLDDFVSEANENAARGTNNDVMNKANLQWFQMIQFLTLTRQKDHIVFDPYQFLVNLSNQCHDYIVMPGTTDSQINKLLAKVRDIADLLIRVKAIDTELLERSGLNAVIESNGVVSRLHIPTLLRQKDKQKDKQEDPNMLLRDNPLEDFDLGELFMDLPDVPEDTELPPLNPQYGEPGQPGYLFDDMWKLANGLCRHDSPDLVAKPTEHMSNQDFINTAPERAAVNIYTKLLRTIKQREARIKAQQAERYAENISNRATRPSL